MWHKILLLSLLLMSTFSSNASLCTGHMVNPLKDICWRCLFPLSIGHGTVVNGFLPDTPNATHPIELCPAKIGMRLGLNIGYWEPMAIVDVTDTPYCLVNLGGHQLPFGLKRKRGGRQIVGEPNAFYHVHWYKYPLISWLNLITSSGCQEGGDFDVAYFTELDPTWQDSEMNFVLNPESALFGNPVAAMSCALDATSSSLQNKPIDKLFWCAGAQGSLYPLTGHLNAPLSPVQSALLLVERLNLKLHHLSLMSDSNPATPCESHHYPITPKSRYRYELVNTVADGKHCYPTGHTTLDWEAFKIKPQGQSQYGFLVWRKRNCVFW